MTDIIFTQGRGGTFDPLNPWPTLHAPYPPPTTTPPPASVTCAPPTTRVLYDNTYSWEKTLNMTHQTMPILQQGQSLAIKFVAGASGAGSFDNVETADRPAADRYATLTKCPGDFTSVSPTDGSGCAIAGTPLTANIRFVVGQTVRGYCPLQPGQTYYFNIRHAKRNLSTGVFTESCPFAECAFWQQMLHN